MRKYTYKEVDSSEDLLVIPKESPFFICSDEENPFYITGKEHFNQDAYVGGGYRWRRGSTDYATSVSMYRMEGFETTSS